MSQSDFSEEKGDGRKKFEKKTARRQEKGEGERREFNDIFECLKREAFL